MTSLLIEGLRAALARPRAIEDNLYYGNFDINQGYEVQKQWLEEEKEKGKAHVGWKIGLTGASIRQKMGMKTPVYGYLLQYGLRINNPVYSSKKFYAPAIESELCLVMGKDLKGPGVKKQDAAEAIDKIFPALEIVDLKVDMARDVALAVATNVFHHSFVLGNRAISCTPDFDFGKISLQVFVDKVLQRTYQGSVALDNQLDSLVWLANMLATKGMEIKAGQYVMSGSFHPPTPFSVGMNWESSFEGIGQVGAQIFE